MKTNRDENQWAQSVLDGTASVLRRPVQLKKRSRFTFGNVVGTLLTVLAFTILGLNLWSRFGG